MEEKDFKETISEGEIRHKIQEKAREKTMEDVVDTRRCAKCGRFLNKYRNEYLVCNRCLEEEEKGIRGIVYTIAFVVFIIILSIMF